LVRRILLMEKAESNINRQLKIYYFVVNSYLDPQRL